LRWILVLNEVLRRFERIHFAVKLFIQIRMINTFPGNASFLNSLGMVSKLPRSGKEFVGRQ